MPINSFLYPGAKFIAPYSVDNSLRFNNDDSPRLSKTEDANQSDGKKLTISVWCKLGPGLGSTRYFFGTSADGSYSNEIGFNANDKIEFFPIGNAQNGITTNRAFRDVSAWYHIVARLDTTQGTNTNRIRLYVNGVQETSFSSSSYPSEDATTEFLKNGGSTRVGDKGSGGNYYDGYLCELAVLDGQSLGPDSFGEFDEDSPTIWKPKNFKNDVTFGNNGFYYEFKETGTSANSSGLGADTSGSGNHMAATNLAATDQSTDTCTNNFLTWNPLDGTDLGDLTFSEGNLKVINATGVCRGTLAASSGKWYWEIKQISTVNASYPIQYGIADTEDSPPTHSSLNNALIAYSDNALNKAIKKFAAGTESTITSTMGSFNNIAQNDIIQFAFDADTAKLWVGRNGTYLNSGDPANGTGEVASTNAGNFFTPCLEHAGATYTIESNFGSPPYSISSGNTDANGHGNFEYAVPSGFFAWNTKNLAEHG
jgi:hypothetical protein